MAVPQTKEINLDLARAMSAIADAKARLRSNEQMDARRDMREAVAILQDSLDNDEIWGIE